MHSRYKKDIGALLGSKYSAKLGHPISFECHKRAVGFNDTCGKFSGLPRVNDLALLSLFVKRDEIKNCCLHPE